MTRFLTLTAAALTIAVGHVAPALAAVQPTPEIDAGAVGAAISLVVGGVLVLRDRRRK